MTSELNRYASERDLCMAFGDFATRCGWKAYAETAGWDMLLVSAQSVQIGVQAKLRWNLSVISQAVTTGMTHRTDCGPDYRAVLLPTYRRDAREVCVALGLVLISGVASASKWPTFSPDLTPDGGWHDWNPSHRCRLPEFVPDVAAGAKGPVQLTEWKVRALRLVATLETRGHITREDFKRLGVDPRLWTGPGDWLLPGALRGQYVRGPGLTLDSQHPRVFAEILAQERDRLASQARDDGRH